jgi:O-succinylbenzoic acid--CoA ligase
VLVPLNTRLTAAERRAQLELVSPRLTIEAPLEGPEADVRLSASVEPHDVQTVLFTSGTSGRPKPVELTYANHCSSAFASAWNLGVAPDDHWLCALPLFHVGGLSILLRSAIYGTAAVVHEGFDADAVRAELESGRVTLVSLVPTMLRRLIAAGAGPMPGLRAALIGGAPAPRDLLARAVELGIPVVETYGMTETASQIATAPAEDALARPARAARPLPGVRLAIAPDGEILMRGPMVAERSVARDGWLHTGDLGRLDEGGLLHVEGRKGDVIITGGENVNATEVEAALTAHPAVDDAAVLGRPDPEWGEVVTAYVVADAAIDAAALAAHCRARLASYKVPRRIHVVDALPRNAAGKLLRGRLVYSDAP